MYIKNADKISSETVKAGKLTTRKVLIGPDQGPNFAMRRFSIAPGGSMPEHTNMIEHEQYVLGGSARVGIDGEVYDVKKDDVVFIPAGVPHWYETTGDEDFEFLCVVPNAEDEIKLVEKD